MKINENAVKVLERRYLAKNSDGELLETVEGLFRRVAKAVSLGEVENAVADNEIIKSKLAKLEEEYFQIMTNLEFLPNSPTLMNAGRPLGQLSACFVLPIEDSMEGIFDSIKNAALIHKSGGGTGFSFSRLRPKGSAVNSTGGVASGPISFMKVFNAATEAVKQGGTRRGANMGILRIDHPDILEFITAKKDNADITNFNISVGLTEEFMKAVEENKNFNLYDPHTKEAVNELNAKEVFDLIVEMAWKNGEPGIIFLDRLNRDNVTPEIGEIESTNPCGEQPLLPYEACNLGSINLSILVKEVDGKLEIDFDRLKGIVHKAVSFLDNVIEVNKYPLPQIDEMTRGTRKIGLGVMGWADLLCKLKIPYNSDAAINLAENVMEFINEEAKKASVKIAEEKGVFPYFEKSIFAKDGKRLRNATVTTIAPTGTLSIIAGVSSGVEPIFAISYIRNVMDNSELVEVNPIFKEVAIKEGFYSDELMKKIAKNGTLHGIDEVPKHIQEIFVTSHDVAPIWHVRMQAAFQKHTDNAVSKTVNLCNSATQEDVKEVFLQAYKQNCKGVTIYRDGSRDLQVLNIGKVKGKEAEEKAVQEAAVTATKEVVNKDNIVKKVASIIEPKEKTGPSVEPRPRPEITTGFTEKVKIGCGNLYITVNYDENGICEVFTNTGRAGGCPSQSEATSRLVSIALRAGLDTKPIIEQLKGIRCPSTIRQKDMKVLSCPDAIGRLIEKVEKLQSSRDEVLSTDTVPAEEVKIPGPTAKCEDNCVDCLTGVVDVCRMKGEEEVNSSCPECKSLLEHEGGCVICRNCGYGKCG